MPTVSILDAATQYVSSLAKSTSASAQAEVNRFVRWYGASRLTDELRGHEISLYSEELGVATAEAKRRADQVRGFLSYLKKEEMTQTNLAPHLRLKKSAKGSASRSVKQRVVEVTAEGHEALKSELEALKSQRPQVREDIRLAMMDKDFRENAPLDAAKDKQAHLESRIREIDGTLKHAVIVKKVDGPGSRVQVGSTVEMTNLNSGASLRYTIVGLNEGNAAQGKITNVSPIGKALLKRREGEEVKVNIPAGVLRLRIEKIEG
ncbi:MAG: transcription elongation factor GreA [Chloroflexi bacterium]|nr:transcription elongation factor GreA [Chloroflexota bacterium]